ncbi:MAG TPA: hypothetical protein VKY22_00530 [Bradyrhizobium sp.]|nr:hypothetical protein [Bradyrhizobium sp.]
MGDDIEQRVLIGSPHIIDPFLRHAEGHQLEFAQVLEQPWLDERGSGRSHRLFRLRARRYNLLDPLANLDELHRARRRVALDLAPFGPFVGVVVMVHIGKKQARGGLVHDQADIGVDAHRPEIRVPGAVDLVELHARRRRIELKVERRRLHGLLLLRCQARERIREGIGDPEFHHAPAMAVSRAL